MKFYMLVRLIRLYTSTQQEHHSRLFCTVADLQLMLHDSDLPCEAPGQPYFSSPAGFKQWPPWLCRRRSWLTMQCPTDGSTTSLLRRRSSCFWSLRRRGLFVFGQLSCDPFVNAVLRLDSDILRSFFCFKHSWSLTVMVLGVINASQASIVTIQTLNLWLGKIYWGPNTTHPLFQSQSSAAAFQWHSFGWRDCIP